MQVPFTPILTIEFYQTKITDSNKIILKLRWIFDFKRNFFKRRYSIFKWLLNLGGTLMDVSITKKEVKTRQLLIYLFSGVWSISYKFDSNFTIDYTGNIYGPMRLPLLGGFDEYNLRKDTRAEFSPWYSIQNIQLTKKIGQSWDVYGGIKNLLNYTPPANSINSSDNPFDEGIDTDKNPELAFDPSYVYASNQGIRTFLGLRYTLF